MRIVVSLYLIGVSFVMYEVSFRCVCLSAVSNYSCCMWHTHTCHCHFLHRPSISSHWVYERKTTWSFRVVHEGWDFVEHLLWTIFIWSLSAVSSPDVLGESVRGVVTSVIPSAPRLACPIHPNEVCAWRPCVSTLFTSKAISHHSW